MTIHLNLPTNAPMTMLSPAPAYAVDPGEWCGLIASSIQRSRALRRRLLRDLPLADCAWDMLLDLYICGRRGVRVSISDLALAADVPRSTGLRWVGNLVDAGALHCSPDSEDGRRTWVTLSDRASNALESYFIELIPDHIGIDMSS